MEWDWTFVFDVVLPHMIPAAWITIYATFASFFLAAILGLGLMLLKRSRNKVVSIIAGEVIEFLRGTPLLVQIFFLFYILPEIGITLPALTSGIISIAIYNSSVCAEVYRAGIEAVPKGQWEAAKALNLGPRKTFTRIILPQSLPPIVPALGNYLILIFKETPLLSFVAVKEVMQSAKLIGGDFYRFTEPVTIAGLFFLIMSLGAAFLVRLTENYVNRRVLH